MPACIEAKPLNDRWEALASRTKLPFRWDLYVRQAQSDWHVPNCKRRSARTSLRAIAILVQGDVLHAAYSKDISRMGMGFFSPVSLLHGEQIWLELPGRRLMRLRTVRCKQLGENCYACGAAFESSAADW